MNHLVAIPKITWISRGYPGTMWRVHKQCLYRPDAIPDTKPTVCNTEGIITSQQKQV